MQEEVCDAIGTQRFLKLDNLVEKISDYDTWQWIPEKKNDRDCYLLSDLFNNTGVEYFLTKYVGDSWDMYNDFEIFNAMDKSLMSDFERKMEFLTMPAIERSARILDVQFDYIDESKVVHHYTKKVKCVTIACSVGELAEKLYEDGIDYVMFFYHDSISVRSRVDDIDLGTWAKFMGAGKSGGGHKRAAGFQMHEDNFYLYKNYLFNKFNVAEEK